MRELLGLSLTVNKVAWTLVDLVDGTIVADSVVEVDSIENVTTAAANGVEEFASHTECHIDAVRIAWSKGTAGSALKLTSELRSRGFSDIDVITEDEARHSRNRTARYIDPPLELAYGAARTVIAEDHVKPLRRMVAHLPARRIFIAVASIVLVMAVSTAAAGYLLVGRVPPPADHASAPVASAPAPADASVVAPPAAPPPPPPLPEAALAPPVELALRPVEVAAPASTDEPEVATEPGTAASYNTAPMPLQAATMARQPHLAAEAPSAGPWNLPEIASLPDTATAAGLAPGATMTGQPHLASGPPSPGVLPAPETASLPHTATAPTVAPAITVTGQPHLPPEALSARLIPGPVQPMSGAAAHPPTAGPPPPPNPLGILAALP